MLATEQEVREWKELHLKTHSHASTNTYLSFLNRLVGSAGLEINQKNIDKFRDVNLSTPSGSAIKSFCRFLVRRKGFPEEILNIRFDKSKKIGRFPKKISKQEVEIIISKMESLKDRVLTIVLFQCALRISEALKLTWSDINWSEWLQDRTQYANLNILNSKRGKFRVIPITPVLAELLYKCSDNKTSSGIPIGKPGNLIFDFDFMEFARRDEPDNSKKIYDYVVAKSHVYSYKLLKIGKENINKKVTPHMLRHSRSQSLLDDGFSLDSLKSFLGHASIATTEIYASASPEKVKKELKALDILNKDKQNG